MSAGGPLVHHDLEGCAPGFVALVERGIAACTAAGLDAMVWEGLRTNEVQELYWRRGRPPTPEYPAPVTNARSSLYSWHGYGLAVDVISRSRRWFGPLKIANPTPEAVWEERRRSADEGRRWFEEVAEVMMAYGLDWGGEWTKPDPPHFQFGRLRASPSDRARELYRSGGCEAVWAVVGAT